MAKNGKRYSRYSLIDTKTGQVVDKSEPTKTDKFLRYRRVKNNIKGEVKDGIGLLGVLLLLVLICVLARILSGVNDGTFTFAQFFQELISFEGVNMKYFISNLEPLKIVWGEDLPNWLEVIANAVGKIVNPLGMILGSLINATWFIGHCLVILFGI